MALEENVDESKPASEDFEHWKGLTNRIPTVAEVEAAFPSALLAFKERFKDVETAKLYTYPFFSNDTIEKFLGIRKSLKKPDTYDQQMKRRLLFFMGDGGSRYMYFKILESMGLNTRKENRISRIYLRGYRYYRYYENSISANDFVYNYGQGKIELFNNDGIPRFERWSALSDVGKPEHSGLLFSNGQYIYMLAMGSGGMRLSITTTGRPDHYLMGVVATPRENQEAPLQVPLAARFIMVPVSNEKLNIELSDSTPMRSNEGKESTRGMLKFADLSLGEYCYAMLASHA